MGLSEIVKQDYKAIKETKEQTEYKYKENMDALLSSLGYKKIANKVDDYYIRDMDFIIRNDNIGKKNSPYLAYIELSSKKEASKIIKNRHLLQNIRSYTSTIGVSSLVAFFGVAFSEIAYVFIKPETIEYMKNLEIPKLFDLEPTASSLAFAAPFAAAAATAIALGTYRGIRIGISRHYNKYHINNKLIEGEDVFKTNALT
jgi:hypothetical protein